MSFGSLSGAAIAALDQGAAMAGCLHNTGEGGLTEHHRHGGDLTFQIGTGYFGCRDEQGRFSLERLLATIDGAPGALHRDQAVPGRQAGPRRSAARGEGHPDRSPRSAASPWASTARARTATRRSATSTR